MKNRVGLFIFIVAIVSMFSVTPVFASEYDTEKIHSEYIETIADSSHIREYIFGSDMGTMGLRGQSVPDYFHTWNLSSSGTYSMSGASSYHDLYTEYNFTGVSSMTVVITPTKVGSVTATFYLDRWLLPASAIETWTIPLGSTGYKTFNGLNSSNKYYVKFNAPCYFTGSIY